jgi:hypothetical protein
MMEAVDVVLKLEKLAAMTIDHSSIIRHLRLEARDGTDPDFWS